MFNHVGGVGVGPGLCAMQCRLFAQKRYRCVLLGGSRYKFRLRVGVGSSQTAEHDDVERVRESAQTHQRHVYD